MIIFFQRYAILIAITIVSLVYVVAKLAFVIRAATSRNSSVSTWDILLTVIIILLFMGAIFLISTGEKMLAALVLGLCSSASIVFSTSFVRVINSVANRSYTTRLPIIWGVGVLIIAAAFALGLI